MNKQLIPCLLLGTVGLCFLGAASSGYRNSYEHLEAGIRPLPVKNLDVSEAGYISVTTPGGEYIVDRRDVSSLSAHNYEIDGGMRVWELTVSERSANTVRFYYTKAIPTEPVKGGNPDQEGVGGKLDSLDGKDAKASPGKKDTESTLKVPVRKSYPATTHAHTIEFRVGTLEELDEVYAYFCLMVYGWSPRQERAESARTLHPLILKSPPWSDWDNKDEH